GVRTVTGLQQAIEVAHELPHAIDIASERGGLEQDLISGLLQPTEIRLHAVQLLRDPSEGLVGRQGSHHESGELAPEGAGLEGEIAQLVRAIVVTVAVGLFGELSRLGLDSIDRTGKLPTRLNRLL